MIRKLGRDRFGGPLGHVGLKGGVAARVWGQGNLQSAICSMHGCSLLLRHVTQDIHEL